MIQIFFLSSFVFISSKTFAGGCEAGFTYTSDDPVIAFTDLSLGTITSYYWDFGDGSYSFEENPVHEYDYNGVYDVCLYVYGTSGSDSCYDAFCLSVEIDSAIESADCEASFYYSVSSFDVSFTNTSSVSGASGITYSWNFGDGSYSSDENPVHVFSSEGTYTICLTVFGDSICSDTYCENITILDEDSSGFEFCEADFGYTEDGLSIAFFNTSDGDILSYYWNFGDGEFSSDENPD
ncbi:MAG: PKD domain-containing protein, partial [Chitinophagales bacterium]